MRRKLLVLLLSLILIVQVFGITASADTFSDVSSNSYYYSAVNWAIKYGVTSGATATTFLPSKACTRAQILTFIWKAAGSPAATYVGNFSDVSSSAYYATAVAWAINNGITTGMGDGTFAPNKACTRAQAMTFLWKAEGAPESNYEASFGDVSSSAYYATAVSWAVSNCITTGYNSSEFRPNNTCTRAQIITFVYGTKIAEMLEPIDIRVCCEGSDFTNADDFWTNLWFYAKNYGYDKSELTRLANGKTATHLTGSISSTLTCVMSESNVINNAYALCSSFNGTVPDCSSISNVKKEGTNYYFDITKGRGEDRNELKSVTKNANGTVDAKGKLIVTDTSNGSETTVYNWSVHLVENPHYNASAWKPYYFSISSIT